MSRFRKEAPTCLGILVLAASAHASPLGLKFNNNFNLTGDGMSLNANLAAGQVTQWENAIIAVESMYSNLFSNSITINLTIDAAPGTSVLGESSTALTGPLSYSEVQTTLADNATSGDDNSVVANLPAIDPTGGGHFLLSTAQAKALGISGPSANSDGTVTFGAGWTYTYDPNNRAVSGEFDFIGVAAHEISEVMGRFGLLGMVLDGSSDYTILDLLGYTSSGNISLVQNANGAYF